MQELMVYPDYEIKPYPPLPKRICRKCGRGTRNKVTLDANTVEYWHKKCYRKIKIIGKDDIANYDNKLTYGRAYPNKRKV